MSYDVVDGHGGVVSGTRTLNLAPVNDDPTGTADASLAIGVEDIPYQVSEAELLQGFNDIDGDTLSVSNPVSSSGTVSDNGDGAYTVNPALNENGAVTLSYDVVDGNGGYVAGSQAFNLGPVNDNPIVQNETITAAENSSNIQIDVLANDSDVDLDELSLTGLSSDQGGTVSISGGKIIYSPATNFLGTETVTYPVSDGAGGSSIGAVVVSVVPNEAPEFDEGSLFFSLFENIDSTQVIHNASAEDPDGDVLDYSLDGADGDQFSINENTGEVTFATTPDYESGKTLYEFSVIASDGTLTDEQTYVVQINNVVEQYTLDTNDLAAGGVFVGEALNDLMDGRGATESLDLSGGAGIDVLYGGEAGDVIDGGDGNDQLSGGGGDDILVAGGGANRVDGGDGTDTLILETNVDEVRILDLSVEWNYSGDGWNQILNVENLVLGEGVDIVKADDLGNIISAGSGNDWIYGNGGDDTLLGGEGTDRLFGGEGIDTVLYDSNENLEINLTSEWQLANGETAEGYDKLISIENVTTGSGDDILIGNDDDNVLTGGGGSDTLTGGDGADVFRFYASDGMTTDVITDFAVGMDTIELVNDSTDVIGDVVITTDTNGSTVTWDELTIVLDVVVSKDDINPIA